MFKTNKTMPRKDDIPQIIEELDSKIGTDFDSLKGVYELEKEIRVKKEKLEANLITAEQAIPAKLERAEINVDLKCSKIEEFLENNLATKSKIDMFLKNSNKIAEQLSKQLNVIEKFENNLEFLQLLQTVEDLCKQLSSCKDDEQCILLYSELKEIYEKHINDKRNFHLRKAIHHWYNELKEKLGKQYENILKLVKWPSNPLNKSQISPDLLTMFLTYTKYLFLLQLPKENYYSTEFEPSIPVKLLVNPLKKRFMFHFTGTRETARIDRPEWFLTQTLSWIKDHLPFLKSVVQPIADKLQIDNINVESEFCICLSNLAAERLYNLLQMCGNVSSYGKAKKIDGDMAFAHAVDEALVFSKNYQIVTGQQCQSVLGILTKAEIFVKWLAIERKYAELKIDDMLSDDQWMEPISAGVGVSTSTTLWVPRGADWFTSMLKTIEDRYNELPSPGHRLQFLEFQLELYEEWHLRLAQILSAAVTISVVTSPAALKRATAVINSTHYTRTVLLQWAHSLNFLQLHYYRRQFQHFTTLHHQSETDNIQSEAAQPERKGRNDSVSLIEIERNMQQLLPKSNVSLEGIIERNLSSFLESSILSQTDTTFFDPGTDADEENDAEVFQGIPDLLKYLRDSGLATIADHIMMEFKANIRDYKRTKWYALELEEKEIDSMTRTLCKPLIALSSHMNSVLSQLAPALASRLKAKLAHDIDEYILEEVVLESWWNASGSLQFKFDLEHGFFLVFASSVIQVNVNRLPKLSEASSILNMEYSKGLKLRNRLANPKIDTSEILKEESIRYLKASEVSEILNKRTDLGANRTSREPTNISQLF